MSSHRPQIDTRAFASEVMRAIDGLPRPTPAQAFAQALRDRSVTDALSALWVAWHLATARGWSPAPAARVRSLALVIGVVMAMGGVSLVAARTVQVVADAAAQGVGALQNGGRDDADAATTDAQSGADDQDGRDGPAPSHAAGLGPLGPYDRASDDEPGGTVADDPNEPAKPDEPGDAAEDGVDKEQPGDEANHAGAGAADDHDQPDTNDHAGTGSGGGGSDSDDGSSTSGSGDGATEPPANDGGDAAPDGSSDGGD